MQNGSPIIPFSFYQVEFASFWMLANPLLIIRGETVLRGAVEA